MALIWEWTLNWNSNDTLWVNNWTDTSISYVTWYKWQCASFNGSTSIIKLPASSIRPTWNFTVNAWINTSNTWTYKAIAQTYSQLSPSISWYRLLVNNLNKVEFLSWKNTWYVLNTDYKVLAGSTSVTTGNWTMVTWVYNWSTLEVFVNGVSDWSVAWTNNAVYQSDSKPSIGANNYQSTTINDYFNWLIDEVRVYDSVENPLTIYNSYRNNPNFFMFF